AMDQIYFRGGGEGDYRNWDNPSIDKTIVDNSLFKKATFSKIFDTAANTSALLDVVEWKQNNGTVEIIHIKTPLTVLNANAPFWIIDSIAYFWIPKFIPDNDTDVFINATASNLERNVVVHNITEHDICGKNISEITRLQTYKFIPADGN
ncbi:hypothetical protein PFISCL1PPCAC_3072, partial [Pristionchus fissidentatus]